MAIQSPSIDIGGAAPVGPALTPVTRGYWQSVRRRLGRDPVTLLCGAVLLLVVVSALLTWRWHGRERLGLLPVPPGAFAAA